MLLNTLKNYIAITLHETSIYDNKLIRKLKDVRNNKILTKTI